MQWLWATLVLLFNFWSVSACPEGCSCRYQQGMYSANCSTLPYNGGKVEALTLITSWDTPLELSDGQFSSAKRLKYLTLRNSSIYFVHKKAFYGAKNMIELDLSFNYIEDLDPMVFQHLSNLKTLSLRGNPIHFVPELPFLISNSIVHLDVGQCKINHIHRGIFYGLKRLQYLLLDGNLLKTLGYNSLPKGLKYLNLSKNLIVNVPTEVISALTNLRRIGLNGNPINCSCSLMNLQDWLSGRGVIFDDDVICASPSKYHGISWSKVDENKLCLAEARREEFTYSKFYNPLYKKRLHRGSYFENENSYSDENIQSDQPHLIPDSEAEILFQNDKTKSMGEMMRDEEAKEIIDKEPIDASVDQVTDKLYEESVAYDDSSPTGEESNTEDSETTVKEMNSSTIGQTIKNEEVLSASEDDINKLQNLQDSDINLKINNENTLQQNSFQDKNESNEATEEKAQNVLFPSSEPSNDLAENSTSSNGREELLQSALTTSQPVNISSVEFKNLNEEEKNTEVDEFKKEGFLNVLNNKYKLEENNTGEEDSTVFPDIENTTDYEFTTELPLPEDVKEQNDINNQSSTSPPDTTNSTIIESETDEEDMETFPPPVVISDLEGSGETKQNTSDQNANSTYTASNITDIILQGTYGIKTHFESIPEKIKEQEDDEKVKEAVGAEKVKEVVGAEVVMFCVGVILICLILYSVYKCRSSSKRQGLRNSKEMESARGTELQDMASLLPKPQENNTKNNVNYNEKSPSSETVKLLPEKTENETPNHSSTDDRNKVEDNNALNNNTPLSPVSATPLIKPDTVSKNPIAPIQRTKVKVGIIPDSIPRTPIFVQKTYNGTKHV